MNRVAATPEAVFTALQDIKMDGTPSLEKLQAASAEDLQELADYITEGDGPSYPKLLVRSVSFARF